MKRGIKEIVPTLELKKIDAFKNNRSDGTDVDVDPVPLTLCLGQHPYRF